MKTRIATILAVAFVMGFAGASFAGNGNGQMGSGSMGSGQGQRQQIRKKDGTCAFQQGKQAGKKGGSGICPSTGLPGTGVCPNK